MVYYWWLSILAKTKANWVFGFANHYQCNFGAAEFCHDLLMPLKITG
jgi:hypothetical protein